MSRRLDDLLHDLAETGLTPAQAKIALQIPKAFDADLAAEARRQRERERKRRQRATPDSPIVPAPVQGVSQARPTDNPTHLSNLNGLGSADVTGMSQDVSQTGGHKEKREEREERVSHTLPKEEKEEKRETGDSARAREGDALAEPPPKPARQPLGPPPETAPADAVAFAAALKWPPERIATEWSRFRDWHLAHNKTRQHAVALMAAWRNWCRSPYQTSQDAKYAGAIPRPGSREDRRERTANALQQLSDYIANAERGGGEAGPPPLELFPDSEPE